MDKFKSIMRILAWGVVIGLPLYFLVATWGTKFGLVSLKFGFGKMVYGWGAKVMVGSAVIGLIALIASVLKPRKGVLVAALALLIPVAALLYAGSIKKSAEGLPFIHDVSTDAVDPPMFTQAILSQRGEGTNPVNYVGKKDPRGKELVSVLQASGYPDIKSQTFSAPRSEVARAARDVLVSLYGHAENDDAGAGETLVQGTHTTFWFGFKDDVIIRVRDNGQGGSVVDMRSLSRVGGSDIGANAARIRKLQAALDKKVD